MPRLRAGAIVLSLVLASTAVCAQEIDKCAAKPEQLELGVPLKRTREGVLQRKELRIVAIGSSSTQGYGASSPFNSYPAELLRVLSKRLEGVSVHIANKGVGGQEVKDMVDRIERDVAPEKPDLVIWQAGTNAAIRNHNLGEFKRQLTKGIGLYKAMPSDLVLMTPQYAPAMVSLSNEDDYIGAMEEAARENNVGLFRRWQIMRYWLQEERMPFAHFLGADGLHLNDFGYRCIGRIFARALLRAVKEAKE